VTIKLCLSYDSGGDKLLPKTLSKEIVSEPFAKNQLREKARLTNIKGLEIPSDCITFCF
jgi:hypothetical protein